MLEHVEGRDDLYGEDHAAHLVRVRVRIRVRVRVRVRVRAEVRVSGQG